MLYSSSYCAGERFRKSSSWIPRCWNNSTSSSYCSKSKTANHRCTLPLILNANPESSSFSILITFFIGVFNVQDIINKCHHNPIKIFNLPEQPNTFVEVDLDEQWEIPENGSHSKSKWTPFAGFKVTGNIHRVVLRGEVVFIEGQVRIWLFLYILSFGVFLSNTLQQRLLSLWDYKWASGVQSTFEGSCTLSPCKLKNTTYLFILRFFSYFLSSFSFHLTEPILTISEVHPYHPNPLSDAAEIRNEIINFDVLILWAIVFETRIDYVSIFIVFRRS